MFFVSGEMTGTVNKVSLHHGDALHRSKRKEVLLSDCASCTGRNFHAVESPGQEVRKVSLTTTMTLISELGAGRPSESNPGSRSLVSREAPSHRVSTHQVGD